MSYILDALRKAERERNLGQAPDLRNVPMSSTTVASRTAAWRAQWRWATVVLILLAIALIIWLRTPRSTAPAAASTPTVVASVPVVTPAETPQAAANNDGGPAQLDDLLDAEPQQKTLSLDEQRKLSAAAPKSTPAKTVQEPAVVEMPAESEKPTMAEQATSEPELPPEIKPLKQMASDYRGNFPKIRIDVHAYDDDPARRFVMINGRKYREGETITEGPTITTIESDGVVFNYNNQEVLVPVGR